LLFHQWIRVDVTGCGFALRIEIDLRLRPQYRDPVPGISVRLDIASDFGSFHERVRTIQETAQFLCRNREEVIPLVTGIHTHGYNEHASCYCASRCFRKKRPEQLPDGENTHSAELCDSWKEKDEVMLTKIESRAHRNE